MAQAALNSRDTDDVVVYQLEEALDADIPAEKNFHIRQALQALELKE